MNMLDGMPDLQRLIETDIPEGRANLDSSFVNLEKVAAYCEANYQHASDKHAAYQETFRFVVQSLASVAYQINGLSYNMQQMLHAQGDKVDAMTQQVDNIGQVIDIHKEKVARREIGQLTTTKILPRQHKIVQPVEQEKTRRYQRTPIDYSYLDDIGHGVRVTAPAPMSSRFAPQSNMYGTISRRESEHSRGGQPTVVKTATLSRNSSRDYKTYNNAVPQGQPQRYAASPTVYAPGSTVSSGSLPYSQPGGSTSQHYAAGHMRPGDDLPPPPSPMEYGMAQHSPPLPPPPPMMMNAPHNAQPDLPIYGTMVPKGRQAALPSWVPQQYVEKVIAIYDYEAQKDDELSFGENSIIYVLRKNPDDWWEGVTDGCTGLFPANYVEPCF